MIKNQSRRSLDHIIRYTSSIGENTEFTGKFTSSDNIVLRGTIISDSTLDGAVFIDSSGHWIGNITTNTVIVLGRVSGDIIAKNKIELLKDSLITGNLNCPYIAIEQGAIHNGNIKMREKTHITTFQEKRNKD